MFLRKSMYPRFLFSAPAVSFAHLDHKPFHRRTDLMFNAILEWWREFVWLRVHLYIKQIQCFVKTAFKCAKVHQRFLTAAWLIFFLVRFFCGVERDYIWWGWGLCLGIYNVNNISPPLVIRWTDFRDVVLNYTYLTHIMRTKKSWENDV